MQFMQCAMYADKPSSSLETEQFRFRFEMAVDRTHSRAFICRRRRRRTPRPTQFRGSDQEGARAQMAPSGVGDHDITEFDITESDVTFFQEFDITESDITEKGNF